MKKRSLTFILATSLLMIASEVFPKFSQTDYNPFALWTVHQDFSEKKISHETWQHFLDNYVVSDEEDIHLVNYPKLKKDGLKILKQYLHEMSEVPIQKYNQEEQIAFWINLYNAAVVTMIGECYQKQAEKNISISPGFFKTSLWKKAFINVMKNKLSLHDIEEKLIPRVFHDFRIYYALNNGSIGAPNLLKQAYQGETLNAALDNAAMRYINSHRGAQVIEGKLVVSKLFLWHAESFGRSPQNIIQHLKQFAKEPLKSQLKHINTIDHYYYNWHINITKTPSSKTSSSEHLDDIAR